MIELKNISKTYKGKFYEVHALKNINLKIDKGEFVAVMGSSGSGKTTLLNMIGLIDKWDEGEVYIDGKKVEKKNIQEYRKKYITFVFQHFALIETDTVYENIALPMLARKVPKGKRKETIKTLLSELGINELSRQLPTKISGGQKQRVAIARALASDTEIILADEPTGALDKENTEDIIKILRKLAAKGKTIILVTHDIHVAECADRIIQIENGEIVINP